MKRVMLLVALTLLALSVISCSAPTPSPANYLSFPAAAPTAAPAMAPPMPQQPGADALQEKSAGGATTNSANAPSAASADRMIVYNVNLRLEVQDADKTLNDITAIAAQYKGYVANTNLARDGKGRMSGSVTLRVPAESLDAAQKQIEAAGLKVLGRNKDSKDVTDQYTDLDARLKNLTATEDELRQMMDSIREKSNKAEDVLAVYRQLTDIRTQIEQIKGQMNVLEKTSAFATLTVQLVPHDEVQVLEPETWVPNRTAAQALRTLVQALQGLADIAIWLILFALPILIVLLLPLIILAFVLRAVLRGRAKKKVVPAA